ncbi:MAG TPA: IS1 family transposase [Chitinophagaceae bacterium]|nr:IS1 family transposase [Chitinophagaceae bacterium]
MNTLSTEKRAQIIRLLVEGNSIRSISRITDVSKDTVISLLVKVGKACWEFHDSTVTALKCNRIQCDEVWSFVYSKEKNKPQDLENAGDIWTWTAIDADTKLIISWNIGNRDAECANTFMCDVADRVSNYVQLTTDGYHAYLNAVGEAFGDNIDFAQLIKLYGSEKEATGTEKKYSPSKFRGSKKTIISGNPDEEHISTSYVERQNLTMRMHMRRFTRLTNAFSKKIENHCYAIALHFVYYNFVRIHKTLRVTPAMEAKLAKKPMTIDDIVSLIPVETPIKRGTYKPRKNILKAA